MPVLFSEFCLLRFFLLSLLKSSSLIAGMITLVFKNIESSVSNNLSFGTPVAAKVDTISGLWMFLYFCESRFR